MNDLNLVRTLCDPLRVTLTGAEAVRELPRPAFPSYPPVFRGGKGIRSASNNRRTSPHVGAVIASSA